MRFKISLNKIVIFTSLFPSLLLYSCVRDTSCDTFPSHHSDDPEIVNTAPTEDTPIVLKGLKSFCELEGYYYKIPATSGRQYQVILDYTHNDSFNNLKVFTSLEYSPDSINYTKETTTVPAKDTPIGSITKSFDATAGNIGVGVSVDLHGTGWEGMDYTFTISLIPLPSVCGNSIVETGETCDDGNTTDLDGCNLTCQDPGILTYTNGDNVAELTGPPMLDVSSITGAAGGTINVTLPVDNDTGYLLVQFVNRSTGAATNSVAVTLTSGTAQNGIATVNIPAAKFATGEIIYVKIAAGISQTDVLTNGTKTSYEVNQGSSDNTYNKKFTVANSVGLPQDSSTEITLLKIN